MRGPLRWLAFALAAAALVPAGPAQSRSRARSRMQLRHVEPRPFAITGWSGRVGVEAAYRSEDQTSDGGSDFHREMHRFEEYVELTGHGFVYHPLFMDWRGRVRLGLLQQEYEDDASGSESIHDLLQEYDFDALFFQEKPVRLRLRANRRDDVVRDLFSDAIRIEENRGGAEVSFVNALAPSRFAVQRQTTHRFGFSQDTETELNTAEASTHILPGTNFTTDLSWRFRDFHEQFRGRGDVDLERDTDLRSNDVVATNTWRFGPRARHRLTTSGRHYDQTGTVDTRQERLGQRLDLRMTPRLESFADWSFDRVVSNSIETRTQRVSAGLHHRLFESLDTFAEVRARRIEFDTAEDETDVGGGVRFAYRRHTPHGQLSGGYGIDVDKIDRGQTTGRRQVIDEAVVLADLTQTFLANRDVILSSIVVTDAAGLTVYNEGLDYLLTEIAGRVRIERVLGGAIADGDLVLVDYDFEEAGDINFTQLTQTFNVRHDWFEGYLEGLSLYYRLGDLRNSGDTGDAELLEFTSHTFGSIYRLWILEWQEEYLIYDANISPYDSLRSALFARIDLFERTQLRAGAEYLTITYGDSSEDDEDLLNLTANVTSQIGRHTTLNAEALYRVDRGRVDEDAVGVAAFVRWAYRKLSAEVGVRLEARDRTDTSRDNVMLFVAVTREF